MQRNNPSVIRQEWLRLYRPAQGQIANLKRLPSCETGRYEPGLNYGPVGCQNYIFRFAMDAERCEALPTSAEV
jgi:hypothetical protein